MSHVLHPIQYIHEWNNLGMAQNAAGTRRNLTRKWTATIVVWMENMVTRKGRIKKNPINRDERHEKNSRIYAGGWREEYSNTVRTGSNTCDEEYRNDWEEHLQRMEVDFQRKWVHAGRKKEKWMINEEMVRWNRLVRILVEALAALGRFGVALTKMAKRWNSNARLLRSFFPDRRVTRGKGRKAWLDPYFGTKRLSIIDEQRRLITHCLNIRKIMI